MQINYTTVNHQARIKLDLTINEYCLSDLIYNLSNNPNNKANNWCYASKETLGKCLGLSKQSIHTILNKLEKKKIIIKNPETKFLQVSEKWYQTVQLKDSKESLPIVKKVYSDSKESLLEHSKESLLYKDNIYIDNNNTMSTDIDDSEELFYQLVETLGFSPNVRFTEQRKRKLKARTKVYSASDLLSAAKVIANDEFLQGENAGAKRYGTIDYLLRNDEIVDRYLEQKPKEVNFSTISF